MKMKFRTIIISAIITMLLVASVAYADNNSEYHPRWSHDGILHINHVVINVGEYGTTYWEHEFYFDDGKCLEIIVKHNSWEPCCYSGFALYYPGDEYPSIEEYSPQCFESDTLDYFIGWSDQGTLEVTIDGIKWAVDVPELGRIRYIYESTETNTY